MLTRVKVNANFDLLYCTYLITYGFKTLRMWRGDTGSGSFLSEFEEETRPGTSCVMSECEGVTRVLALSCQNAKERHGFWVFLSQGGGWPRSDSFCLKVWVNRVPAVSVRTWKEGSGSGCFCLKVGVTRVLAVFCQNAKGRHGFWLFLSEGGGGDPGSCYLQHHPLPVTNISVSRGRGWVGGVSL
jgi:hypothetical protein